MRDTTVISDARKNPHVSMSMNYTISCDHIHVVLKGFIFNAHGMDGWSSKQPVLYGCFNWMIPNHYIQNGCLGYQVATSHEILR